MTTAVELPGYVAGLWTLDPIHTNISFSVRHLMVSKVRGRFTRFEGELYTAPNPLDSWARATIDLTSVDTGHPDRDNDLRSANYFEIETYPEMTYRSTAVHPGGQDTFPVDGDLSLHGVTRQVQLTVEVLGFTKDPWGGTRAGFSARGEINRKDFGLNTDIPMDGGGVVVGERIEIFLEVEAILKEPAGA
jgi:polyisoprenoid-binding protein YceI